MQQLLHWSSVLRQRYGERVQKVTLDVGAGCPNRVGLRSGGCIFCDERGGGSGAFLAEENIEAQVKKGVNGALNHYRAHSVMIYFQSYSATYLPLLAFETACERALRAAVDCGAHPVGLCVGTRPDLVPTPVLDYLQSLNERLEVWLELGVQTIDERALIWMKRGHGLSAVEDAFNRLRGRGIRTCAHLISGLPGENPHQLRESALWLASRGVNAIKFHPLHVLRGTELERLFLAGQFLPIDRETYLIRLLESLLALPDGIILQRLTAGVRPSVLVAPLWVLEKEPFEREITKRFQAAIKVRQANGIL